MNLPISKKIQAHNVYGIYTHIYVTHTHRDIKTEAFFFIFSVNSD